VAAGVLARPKTHTPGARVSNLGQRFYSPNLGRWLSRDPIGEMGGANLHMFCNNAASVWIDVDGRGCIIPWPTPKPYELTFEEQKFTPAPAECGTKLKWEIEWKVSPDHAGAVMQHVRIRANVHTCDTNEKIHTHPYWEWGWGDSPSFWEAFSSYNVPAGGNGAVKRAFGTDLWDVPILEGTYGEVVDRGTAYFHEAPYNLWVPPVPEDKTWEGQKLWKSDPGVSRDSNKLTRSLKVSWNCCCDKTKRFASAERSPVKK